MMIIEIALVSRAKMDEFRSQYGAVTFAALDEIMRLNAPGTWEIAKYLPGLGCRPEGSGWEPIDCDCRFAQRGLRALELAHSRAGEDSVAVSDAQLVYKQVVPGHADFDDSGTTAEHPPRLANTLSPQRCREILESWAVTDLPKLEQEMQKYPNLFEELGPAYVFKDARQFIEYLRVYVRYLGQAAAEDRYFVSFFA